MIMVSRSFRDNKIQCRSTRPSYLHIFILPTHVSDTTESDDNNSSTDSIVSDTMDIELIDCEFEQLDPQLELDNYLQI